MYSYHEKMISDKLAFVLETPLKELLEHANHLRKEHFGRTVETCMIVNAKCGQCVNDCKFCSQSVHNNTDVAAFPLLKTSDLLQEIEKAINAEVMHIGIVTSGQTVSDSELDQIAEAVSMASQSGKIKVCASLGQLSHEALLKLKSAGLSRFHHNLETSKTYYPKICTTQKWEDRLETVRRAKDVGLEVCSGALFGLGESWNDRVELALTLHELGVNSVPMNFLHAHSGIPLANQPPITTEEALRIIALFRLCLPQTSLRICGGRPKILGPMQNKMFFAGANALMTGNYLTTSGITPKTDRQLVESLGLNWGNSSRRDSVQCNNRVT